MTGCKSIIQSGAKPCLALSASLLQFLPISALAAQAHAETQNQAQAIGQTQTQTPTQEQASGKSEESGQEHKCQHAHNGFHKDFKGADHWVKIFDDPSRAAWQKPNQVITAMQIKNGERILDLGAGTGYFALPIAQRFPEAVVYGADCEPDMVKYMQEQAGRKELKNLQPMLIAANSPQLPDQLDLVLVVDTYHHIDDRITYFQNLKNHLNARARLVIIDFTKDSDQGPPPAHRLSIEQVKEELNEAGYRFDHQDSFLPKQYMLTFSL